jgi:hypothetical protein
MFTKCDPIAITVALIRSAAPLPFGRLWCGEPDAINNAIGYAKFFSQSHPAIIRVFDESDAAIERPEHTGDFKER